MSRSIWLFVAFLVLNNAPASAGEWIIDIRTGCRVWNANPQPDQLVKWSGKCVDDIAQGSGVLQWRLGGRNSDRFKGTLANGRRQGKGTMQWIDDGQYGARYDGAWRNDKRAGRGVMVWPDGSRFDGDWNNDRMFGRGVMVWADGRQ